MALATYGDLKSSVASWLNRSDLTTQIVDFIAIAEQRIRQDVRVRAMEASATGSLSATTLAFPTRLAEIKRVVLNGYQLDYLPPESFSVVADTDTSHYTTKGEVIHFQKASGDYIVEYLQWFAPFSDNADTNWLLTNHPAVYLYAALAEAAVWLRDRQDIEIFATRYQAEIARIRASDRLTNEQLVVRTSGVV